MSLICQRILVGLPGGGGGGGGGGCMMVPHPNFVAVASMIMKFDTG